MGTNFYLRRRISAEQKKQMKTLIDLDEYDQLEELIPHDIHIGKRSCGWKFLWNANGFEYFKPDIDSIHEFLKSGDIYDEYGQKYTYEEFMNDEIGKCIKNGYDIAGYYIEHPDLYASIRTDSPVFEKLGITVNQYGEFYIGDYRFTVCDEFS